MNTRNLAIAAAAGYFAGPAALDAAIDSPTLMRWFGHPEYATNPLLNTASKKEARTRSYDKIAVAVVGVATYYALGRFL
jgi:hypothetical protein